MRSKSFSLQKEFEKFSKSCWGLELCLPAGRQGLKIIFRSKKSGVRGFLDFVKNHENVFSRRGEKRSRNFVIFDKIVGRGAALLSVYLGAKAVYGKIGSKSAKGVFRKYGTKFYFSKTVKNILNRDGSNLCPLEVLSSKKSPRDFYKCLILSRERKKPAQ